MFHIGGRYRFKLFGKPATARLLVNNVFDKYGWQALSNGVYGYNAPRRFTRTSPPICRSLNFQRAGRIKDAREGSGVCRDFAL